MSPVLGDPFGTPRPFWVADRLEAMSASSPMARAIPACDHAVRASPAMRGLCKLVQSSSCATDQVLVRHRSASNARVC